MIPYKNSVPDIRGFFVSDFYPSPPIFFLTRGKPALYMSGRSYYPPLTWHFARFSLEGKKIYSSSFFYFLFHREKHMMYSLN